MKKCKKCREKNEQWVGENLDIIYEYCGLIEKIIEDAIDINDITKCPYELMINQYRDKDRQNFESLYEHYLKER